VAEVLQSIWDWFLDLTSKLVIPDWGGLIALLPVGVMAVVIVWLVFTVRRLRGAPPARRGPQPVKPKTPAGIHMPGPSFAPVFAAIGTALLLLGLVFGGTILWLGVLALILTLLYWLAEAMRLYDHDVEPTVTTLPAVIHDGPPPGVHMPGPSFRPIIGALGMAILMFGLVFGGWLLLAGVFALILTLVPWLVDAMREYRATVEAERTGHIDNGPAPRVPTLLISVLAVLFVGGILFQTGLLPPGSASAGGPTASGSPGPSGPAPSGAPPPSAGPATPAPTGDVTITAKGIAFVEASVTGPGGKPFTVVFDNEDSGIDHNVEFKDASGASVWQGEPIKGVKTVVYDVPSLPAGSYTFVCTIHSNMTGTATLQ
jgi:plastocyanin